MTKSIYLHKRDNSKSDNELFNELYEKAKQYDSIVKKYLVNSTNLCTLKSHNQFDAEKIYKEIMNLVESFTTEEKFIYFKNEDDLNKFKFDCLFMCFFDPTLRKLYYYNNYGRDNDYLDKSWLKYNDKFKEYDNLYFCEKFINETSDIVKWVIDNFGSLSKETEIINFNAIKSGYFSFFEFKGNLCYNPNWLKYLKIETFNPNGTLKVSYLKDWLINEVNTNILLLRKFYFYGIIKSQKTFSDNEKLFLKKLFFENSHFIEFIDYSIIDKINEKLILTNLLNDGF